MKEKTSINKKKTFKICLVSKVTLTLVVGQNMSLEYMDVMTIFFYNNIDDHIYKDQPKSSSDTVQGRLIFKLKMYFYGLMRSQNE